ncbi:hypothetical protein CCR90_07070 [Rhodovulum sulfidophilum]|uniref:DUF6950 family protein n=1 Tax=Rhodovulum sulfidophilum TaxID=35806 RepID=UPI001F5E0329|nr:hypothetical protein [Rhodovulum sulfidophilum]MBK5923546.1 hypothetical protein [Rhodovulum sulfidophilum]
MRRAGWERRLSAAVRDWEDRPFAWGSADGLTLLTCAPVAQAPPSVTPAAPYQRAAFGSGWTDPDGDCLDTRAELLADLSTVRVTLAPSGCSVRHGR